MGNCLYLDFLIRCPGYISIPSLLQYPEEPGLSIEDLCRSPDPSVYSFRSWSLDTVEDIGIQL